MHTRNRSFYWLTFFIILKVVIQFATANMAVYDLHRDEYLYLDQANHPAFGFHSVPPLTSWLSWLIAQTGNSEYLARLIPLIFGCLTLLVVWKTTELLGGKLYACVLAATAVTLSTLLRLNLLFQPNSGDIFFWTTLFFCIVQQIKTQDKKWYYYAALAFAFGFLNKYNILFCMAGVFPALLILNRRFFFNKHLYLSALLAIVIIFPNLVWQYVNGFPVITHMEELTATQLVNVSRLSFLTEQVMMFLGPILVVIAGLIGLALFPLYRSYRFILLGFVLTLTLFVFLRAKAYYAYGLYPILYAFGAVYIERLSERKGKLVFRSIPMVMIILLFIPLVQLVMPIHTPEKYYEHARNGLPMSEHTWEDGKKHPISQDFADMRGWRELARKVDSIYQRMPDKRTTLILADNYGQTGAINFYSKIPGLKAQSLNKDYVRWFHLDHEVRTIIRIVAAEDRSPVHRGFATVTEAGMVTDRYAREYRATIYVLTNPLGDIKAALNKEAAKRML